MLRNNIRSLAFFFIFTSSALLGADSPTNDMTKIGEGKLRYMFWDVYKATLYADSEDFDRSQTYAIDINYLRSISKKYLLKSTQKEIRRQVKDEDVIEEWIQKLDKIWPDVDDGDRLTLVADESKIARFYLNDRLLGEVNDAKFTRAFSNIWLAEGTSKPDLRKKMLNLQQK